MCRLYGKLDDVTERNSLVLEKGGKSMRKEKKKMSIKRRIAAAALAAFVGVSSLNVSIPGFSTVITDADETEIASQLSEENTRNNRGRDNSRIHYSSGTSRRSTCTSGTSSRGTNARAG